jgi:O-antigen/teichoic acid export membrane protein
MHKILLPKFGLMFLISVAAYGINYGLNVILAHLLPAIDYGNYAIINEILLFTSLLFLQGSNFAVLKYVPEYIHSNQKDLLHGYLHYNFRAFIISSFCLLGLTLLGVIFLLTPYNTKISILLFVMVIILIFIYSIFSYLIELIKAIKHIFLSTILFDIAMPLIFATIAGLILLTKHHSSLLLVSFVYFLAIATIALIAGFFCYRAVKIYLTPKKTKSLPQLWRTSSAHLMISKLILIILFSSEILILKIFGHTPEDVGIFAAILAVGSLFWVLFDTVTHVLSPLISPLVYAKQKHKLHHLFLISTGFLVALAIILSLILIFFRIPILNHFNHDFIRGANSYIIIMIGYAVTVSLGLPWYFIGLSGNQQKLVWPVSWVTITSILITIVLVHYFNLLGAAIGLAATDIIMGSFLIIILYKLKVFN